MSSNSPSQTMQDVASLRTRIAELERELELARVYRSLAVAANEAGTVEEAMETALREICRLVSWPVGHGYLRDEAGVFRPTDAWYLDDPEGYSVFRAVTAETSFERGAGLVGRVAARDEAEWIRDVGDDRSFVRARAAPVEVKAALAVPVAHGDEVLGILEFFSDTARPPDPDLMAVVSQAGTQLGIVVARSRAERALRISEEKFSGIVSISAEAIISVDARERIVHFNQGARDVFGYEPDEVLGEPLEILIPERFRERHHRHVEEFGASEVRARRMGERQQEVYGLRKSGEEFPAEASISRLEVEGETLFSVVLRDVSEQRRYEEALERHARELERSNRELEQFAFVASHDLQEPLRKIRSFGDRLVSRYRDELDERGRDYLERMHGAADRMAALIQDLLAFSRVTTRANPPEPTDLSVSAREALSDLEQRIRETDGEVRIGELPTVDVDPVQMRQLFQNLVGNALKYHREDVAPRVEITGKVVDGSGNDENGRRTVAEIRVRDNGVGFDEKYAERIFGVFERLHGRGASEGTGIGLAICRKIAERHGGTITAASSPGEGSTFTIVLPLRADGPEASVGDGGDGAGGAATSSGSAGRREDKAGSGAASSASAGSGEGEAADPSEPAESG